MKKYLIILFSLFVSIQTMAQTSYYDTQWKEVEALTKKQKSKDAEALIREIMSKAKSEKNKEQIIKSLVLLRQSVAQRDEQNSANTIQDFEKEIQGLEFPEKNIMHSMIASLYHQYYQQNRYKIYQRTEISNVGDLKYPDDIETWTPQLFFKKIQENFDASLVNTNGLKKYPISQFPELITEGQNTENLHPTLFDVLVHRAIDYYTNNEIDITKAAYFFKLKNENAFATAKEFSTINFTTKDDFSTKYIALSYLQLATRFHLSDAQPDALIDLEAKRLQFVHHHFDGNNGDSLYKNALEKLIKKYPENETIAKVMLLLTQHLLVTVKPSALKLAQQIQQKFPDCVEKTAAYRIETNILEKSISLTTEKADVADNNILGLLNFTNVKEVFFRVIPISLDELKNRQSNMYQNNDAPSGKVIRSWSQTLDKSIWQGEQRYNAHTTEIKIDKLPNGIYAVLAAADNSFNPKIAPVSYVLYQATDISYAVSNMDNNNTLYVLHRQTGKPLPNISVTRYSSEYNYDSRRNVSTKIDTKTTDQNGRIVYESTDKNYRTFDLEITDGKQKLWVDNAFYSNRTTKGNDREYVTFFTDRAIYRPGQTIYFKGIYIKSAANNREHNVVANKKIDVILKDANYKDVKKLTLTTNEFGSLNGSFTAPEGLLNGRFTIYSAQGQTQIRVEEYKRPKFEVVMDSVEKNVKLNETIEVTGQAKSYAGNTVEGAKVSYIVRRKVHWPYYWYYYYWGNPGQSEEIVVSQGETITDGDGKFTVSFFAEGDDNIDPRTKPFYDFEVSVDVTDINGEVRSGTKSYAISEQSLILNVAAPEQIEFNEFNSINVSTTNVQGKFTAADVKLEFVKLEAPNRFLKKRMWEAPKNNLLTQADFETFFPDYEYKNESNPLFWEEEKIVWTKTIRTDESRKIFLQKIAPDGGYYLLKATTRDKDGNLIEEKKVVRLLNKSNIQAQNNEALLTYLSKNNLEPNDQTTLSVVSTFRNAHIHKTIHRQNTYSSAWSDSREQFSITENDRGGFMVNYFMVHGNRLYQESVVIAVPWSNKDLNISYETFRDKILPGSQQEWKIKISGNKKEKVSAELLAAMYDASLDALAKNDWNNLKLYQDNYGYLNWLTQSFGTAFNRSIYIAPDYNGSEKYRQYPQLNMYGLASNYGSGLWQEESRMMRSNAMEFAPQNALATIPGVNTNNNQDKSMGGKRSDETKLYKDETLASEKNESAEKETETNANLNEVHLRTNLSETAFFFPDLQTDKDGNIIFSFTAPEVLTRWNVKTLAHTKNLKTAFLEKTLVTQKVLMLTPNHPRFMRENDKMVYSSKLSNLSDKNLNGTAHLEIMNAKTEENINALFANSTSVIPFDIAAGKSTELTWDIQIPDAFTYPVLIRIVAQAGNLSDGEQQAIPLLLNSMLVTETIPLPVRPNTTKHFSFEKLLNSGKSNTLKHHKLTVEYTSNPAWHAVQALPYLTDYPYECSEQTFNRYYANALASHIANSSPRIQEIFSKWKDIDTTALLSNLEKNQELKSALLQETPWVFEAENETGQKKLIANLFNMNRMSKELKSTLDKLEKLQTSNGGFAWFKGMRDNPYITQYIITGIARLQKLGVAEAKSNEQLQTILNKAIPYLDARLVEDYEYLKKEKLLKNNNLSYHHIQYLYMRSFYLDRKMNAATKKAFDYYKEKSTKHWMDYNKYMQGMLAISMNRYGEQKTAYEIMDALRQNAIHSEEMGMYWKEFNQASYWWYEAPIEAHSLLMEAFREIPAASASGRPGGKNSTKEIDEVDEMRIWLLKQKQTQQWATTKATADACYALLLGGTEWLTAEPFVEIKLGDEKPFLSGLKSEAGTGYTKFSYKEKEVKSEMGNIAVTVKSDKNIGTTWGAVYWQYFEQLDKITEAETPLSLKKQVYKVVNGDRGESLVLIKNNEQLKVGDKVKVRIELRVDRRMEFVHMKDMRGACFEPSNVLSNYKYQNGLGYYESTKDASTQFFFDNLNPGTYVFEYPMFATMRGDYSNGIATIQCMYAPEFSSNSEGIRVQIK